MKFTGLFLLTVCLIFTIQAQPPTTMNFQGNLTDPGTGSAIADGDYDIDFSLWDADVSGASFWSETQIGVTVINGIFNVKLGSVNPLVPADFAGPLWLEITISAETLSPRIELASAAYSLNSSNTSSYVTPYTSIPAVGPAFIAGDTSTQNYQFGPPTIDLAIDDNDTGFDVLGDGDLSFYTNGQERMLLDFIGTLYIGSPISSGTATKLELNYDDNGTGFGGMWITNSATTALPYYGYENGNGVAYHYIDGGDANKWKLYNGGIHMTVQPNGNVGVGTTTPSEKLSVNGNIATNGIVYGDEFTYNTPKTEYLFVPAPAFIMYINNPAGTEYLTGFPDRYATGASAGNLIDIWAPIYLPHNSTITEIEYYISDTDATYDHGSTYLYTINNTGTSSNTLIGSYTGSGGNQVISSGPVSIPVDNTVEGLFIYSYIRQGTSVGTLRTYGARVSYTVPSP